MLIIKYSYAFTIIYYRTAYGVYKRKLVQKYVDERDSYKDSLQLSTEKINKFIYRGKNRIKVIQKRQIEIDKKLKQDEKIIDNCNVTNDELCKFYSQNIKKDSVTVAKSTLKPIVKESINVIAYELRIM